MSEALAGEAAARKLPFSLSIVSVAYNSASVLPGMLASVPDGVEVVVVDNASADGSVAVAEAAGARVVRLPRNLGFGAGCNAGAAVAGTEWLLFLNPDTTLEPGALDAMARGVARWPEAGGFNPTVRGSDGEVGVARRTPLAPRSERMRPPYPDDDFEVPSLLGSAILVRRAHFDRVGGFDERIFLYFEDDDLSARLRAEIGPLVYLRGAGLRHEGASSSPPDPARSRMMAREGARAKRYVLAKHGYRLAGPRVLAEGLVRLMKPKNAFDRARREAGIGFFLGAIGR